jgi:hypothetical protein
MPHCRRDVERLYVNEHMKEDSPPVVKGLMLLSLRFSVRGD